MMHIDRYLRRSLSDQMVDKMEVDTPIHGSEWDQGVASASHYRPDMRVLDSGPLMRTGF